MGTIQVRQAGMLTTIQDRGRWGFGRFGMPVAGAMDEYAARVANILLGNEEQAPVLEMTLTGPVLVFDEELDLVVTGGDLQPRFSNCPVPLWSVCHVQPGETLSFAGLASGCRAYMAVSGGFDVPLVMGSAATYLRGKLGGCEGRALKAGDVLRTKPATTQSDMNGFTLPGEFLPAYRERLRVILGPQDDHFTPDGIDTFCSAEYTVTNEADRMGYRLDGPKIEHVHGADIISDGIAPGAIQVPAHGTPIIMLADRQTTGGYTKIAHVITVDIPSVAQKKPGDTLTFEPISIEDAQRLYREREAKLDRLRVLVQQIAADRAQCFSRYTVTIDGDQYAVSVQEIA